MAIIQANFYSELLRRTVRFNAFMPVDHATPPAMPLKTLYLLHGYTRSAMRWFETYAIGGLAEQNGLAIIMPDGDNHFYVDDEQRGDLYGEFIGRELVEFTRHMFPLSEKREDTIIGGFSMGGYGALRNGLKYNGTFGHIIAISPAASTQKLTDSTDEPDFIGATRGFYESVFGDLSNVAERDVDIFWLAEQMAKKNAVFPDIYFACGYNDTLVNDSRMFDKHLTALSVPHVYEENEGTHDNQFFTPHFIKGLSRIPLNRQPITKHSFFIETP